MARLPQTKKEAERMKILVADDDAGTRITLVASLTRRGYEVVAAANGDEALDILLRDDAPALAILDWMMPGRDGVQVCRELRARKAPYTYILMLSGKREKEDFIAALAAGVDEYIRKPFDFDELHARIQAAERILKIHESLRTKAHEDELTGVLTRAGFRGMLRHVLAHSARHGGPVSVIFADIDNLKCVNDAHGYSTGDEVLREVAKRVTWSLRAYDAVGRFGGDEFLIVLPGCAGTNAVQVAERLRSDIAATPISSAAGLISITLSFGVTMTENGACPVDALIATADEALYHAKQGGRNRVMMQLQCASTLHAPYPPTVG
jgi:two-component system, cell cycle response regulator